MGHGRSRASFLVVLLAVGLGALSGCASAARPTPSKPAPSSHPSPTASPLPTSVTVISPLGVNFRTEPSTTSSVVGVVAQGVSLPIVSHSSSDGGWWEVRGSSQTGWITAQPQYTSTITFQTFSSGAAPPWSVMYPEGWTFAQENSGPIDFTGPAAAAITFTSATTTSQLPAAALAGQTESGVSSVVVYGVTAPLVTYSSTTKYEASVEFQAQPALAFLIQAQLPTKGGAPTLNLFLETVSFTVPATPSP